METLIVVERTVQQQGLNLFSKVSVFTFFSKANQIPITDFDDIWIEQMTLSIAMIVIRTNVLNRYTNYVISNAN